VDSEEEDEDEAGVVLPVQKSLSVGHVGEKGICQEDVLNPNASYVIKKGIQRSSALENQ